MSDHTPDEAPTDARYDTIEIDDGTVVLYDGDNAEAWMQSDTTVDVRP
jgi:hypothetical protein